MFTRSDYAVIYTPQQRNGARMVPALTGIFWMRNRGRGVHSLIEDDVIDAGDRAGRDRFWR